MRSARKSNNIRLMTEHSREKSPECFFYWDFVFKRCVCVHGGGKNLYELEAQGPAPPLACKTAKFKGGGLMGSHT